MVKKIAIALFSLLLIAFIGFKIFVYKIENGIPVYQTEKHNITFPQDKTAILLFSKTTGFRHGASIEASKPVFNSLSDQNNWFLYETENAGIFNEEELPHFDVVIWNNVTGRCLTDTQRFLFEKYLLNGGGFIGIHGSGDGSHHWKWYLQELIGAKFSHHPIKNQIQEAEVILDLTIDSTLRDGLKAKWNHQEEWYIFHDSPAEKGFIISHSIDGNSIDPDGNLPFIIRGKNFGMEKFHPVAWHKKVGSGTSFYTSLGHRGEIWQEKYFIQLIENAIKWSAK